MTRERSRALLGIHGRLGLFLGLVLYIVAISGVMSLFVRYLPSWEDERLRVPQPTATRPETETETETVDPVLDLVRAARPDLWQALPIARNLGHAAKPGEAEHDVLLITLPSPLLPVHTVAWLDETHTIRECFVDLSTRRVLDGRPHGLTDFVRGLHTDLLLPTPWGRYLVGLFGVIFLLLIVTGFWFHARVAPERLHTFRVEHGARTMWSDLHKVIGIWGLLFHGAMALTGALLGLLGVIIIVVALAATRGDQEAAVAAVLHPPPARTGTPATMQPVDAMLRRAHAEWPGFVPESVVLHAWGDRAATVELTGLEPGRFAPGGATGLALWFNAETGAVTRRVDWSRGSLAQRLYAVIVPLHYATMAGLAMRVLYALLGVSTTLLAVSGLWIWIEGRQRRHDVAAERERERDLTAWRLERFTLGTVIGVPTGLAAAACVARLWPATVATMDAVRLPGVWAGAWIALVVVAWMAPSVRAATRRLTWIAVLTFVGIPVANTIATGVSPFAAWRHGLHAVLVIDAGALLVGAIGVASMMLVSAGRSRATAADRRPRPSPESDPSSPHRLRP